MRADVEFAPRPSTTDNTSIALPRKSVVRAAAKRAKRGQRSFASRGLRFPAAARECRWPAPASGSMCVTSTFFAADVQKPSARRARWPPAFPRCTDWPAVSSADRGLRRETIGRSQSQIEIAAALRPRPTAAYRASWAPHGDETAARAQSTSRGQCRRRFRPTPATRSARAPFRAPPNCSPRRTASASSAHASRLAKYDFQTSPSGICCGSSSTSTIDRRQPARDAHALRESRQHVVLRIEQPARGRDFADPAHRCA